MNIVSLVTDPKEFFLSKNDQENKVNGIIIGIIATYSFPLTSYIARVLLGKSNNADIIDTFIIFPIMSLFLFALLVLCIFVFIKLFRGKGKYLPLASNIGWASIPTILISICFIILLFGNELIQTFPAYKQLIMTIEVFTVFLVVAGFLWSVKLGVLAISVSADLGIFKSVIVFVLATIIWCIPSDYLYKLVVINNLINI